MQNAGIVPQPLVHPACSSHAFDSDTYWECFTYNTFATADHPTSSAKMAPDSSGVVDERLR